MKKKIKMLSTTAWWDEGQTFTVYAEDDNLLIFETEKGKVSCLKSEEGKLFKYVSPSGHQRYYQENQNEVLEQKRNYRKELKEQVLIRLGSRCKKCGYNQMGALDVKGGEPRGQKGYTAFYNQVLKIVEMSNEHPYYLLCANCQRLEE